MEQVKVTLKDGSVKEVPKGTTILELAKSISGRLGKEAVAGELNGKVVDLNYKLDKNCKINIFKFDDEEGKDVFRHTSSHILAQAVQKLFPGTKLAIGPAIENGYYYDFDSDHKFTPEDLEKIEKEMSKIAKEGLNPERFELPREEAIKYMEEKGEPYKVELIKDLPEDAVISFYKQGDFVDLCAGPHLPTTKIVKALKLLSIAGAYWRGDEKNKMLQRIYGTSFPKKKLLEEYINRLEEAKKRDHRKLGKELKLFTILEEGPGFPFFLPKGMELKNTLMDYWREVHKRWGYVEVETPIILNRKLWETSGHWYHYKENMYTLKIDEEDYAIKPMNCPGGMLVYKTEMRSYRDFPMRVGEVGRVHRHELSGALHGLMRVRAFTQDDAHIFMLPEQIKDEIKGVAKLIDEVYTKFGFKYHVELSTRPENSMGNDEDWNMAEDALREALEEENLSYKLNEGDGAFYGPKIDFHLEDCIGRTWQCGTIQLDFQLPQRFDLTYIGKDGEKHRPIVIHRVAFGSIERFIGILIEHFAGKFPTWLAPEQVRVLPITDKHVEYAKKVAEKIQNKNIKVEVDSRNEKIGYKIREAQLGKVPYMLILGDKELENDTISVRSRDKGELGNQDVDSFIDNVVEEIKNRTLIISE
ncbi:threonine--tRNA ligase [Maledivibacter halophilus]|uniref:Threonine--tRNA ligase n=1 Tax=Maledivibacter halophilus TaxID=36842 RepID=A0A1T5IWG6_9FIRM|nr:threonine--tRNA ligase [Maledivibacter halophilus]SKC43461.1 threonyl-tRNA synthetase [Maledivibacter halophilus]